jgi:endonuclease/exonuclease/phosphatase (EEP) superfamily protein YafD
MARRFMMVSHFPVPISFWKSGAACALVMLAASCSEVIPQPFSETIVRTTAADSGADAVAPRVTDPFVTYSPTATSGKFTYVIYNIAGLPQAASAGNPAKNVPLLTPRLNAFDVALLQEDFAYHAVTRQNTLHPFISEPKTEPGLGDGLTFLSRIPVESTSRATWEKCNGVTTDLNDCLTPKGFQKATLRLPGQQLLDIYNLHADAGGSAGDQNARSEQMRQLARAINETSQGRAVLVGGDFNMREPDAATFQTFQQLSGTKDVCLELPCQDVHNLDRITYRNGTRVTLRVSDYVFDRSFVDENMRPLSDHEPVHIAVNWQLNP